MGVDFSVGYERSLVVIVFLPFSIKELEVNEIRLYKLPKVKW